MNTTDMIGDGGYLNEPWSQQRGEPALQFARFTTYLDSGPARNMSALARAEGIDSSSIREAALKWRWRERANLYDAEQRRRHLADMHARRRDLQQRAMNVAVVTVGLIGANLRRYADVDAHPIDVKDLPAFARMADIMHRIASDSADATIAITGHDGGPIRHVLSEFVGLTEEEKDQRAVEMAAGVTRLADARRRGERVG